MEIKTKDEYPNKISEKEMATFVADKLSGEEYSYHHSDDCRIEGCPGHKAQIKYNSVSDIIRIDLGDGTVFYLDSTQADIIWDWFNRAKL